MKVLLTVLFALLSILPAAAQERILSYDSEVEILADGTLEVTENIVVNALGNQIRRGIYRDFPTRYRDRFGNRVNVGFEMIEVRRNGEAEPWFTEDKNNGIRINTGNDNLLPTPAEYHYTLRYRTTRQLGFFQDHDELYWNAIGTGWIFPIDRGSVQVNLPQPVPEAQMQAEAYTGRQGQKGSAYKAQITGPGAAHWQLTRPLAPNEGLTIVLSFPKGVIAAPSPVQRGLWLLKDNLGLLIGLSCLITLIGYCIIRWHQVGRDPKSGIIIVRYEPPPGYSPGGLRFLRRMRYDMRCFSSDLLTLAVAGKLSIHCDKQWFKKSWRLEKTGTLDDETLNMEQRTLFSKLFAKEDILDIENTNAKIFSDAKSAHQKVITRRIIPALIEKNTASYCIALAIAIAGFALTFYLSNTGGRMISCAMLALMLLIVWIFSLLVKKLTPAGRALLDEIEGFKRYLSVAERDELKSMSGPDAPPLLDGQRYEGLLPYAVALEVEDAWTKKFTAAAGAAMVAATTGNISQSWYPGGEIRDLNRFSKDISSSLTSQISSSSTPPGSSSGSSSGGGGGGFSGGGGGGGGGGGR